MTPDLQAFFDTMVPYYQSRTELDHVVRTLGASPSGPVRFDFYRRLMAANRRRILRHVFPSLHRLWTAPGRGGLEPLPMTWDELAARFADAHPVGHWDPNELGRALPDWLEAQAFSGPIIEAARWSWRLLSSARAEDGWDGRIHRSVSADYHPFDVAQWLESLERAPSGPPPTDTGLVLVVYRDRTRQATRVLRPTVFELAALARASGEEVEGLDLDAVDRGERRLVTLGLLAEPTP